MSHTDSAHGHAGDLDNHDIAHEESDVNVRALVGFAIGLFVVVGVVYLLMFGLFRFFDRQAARNDPPVSPLAQPTYVMPASTLHDPFFGNAQGPRLMTNEPSILGKQRAMEADVLGTYGWVDEKAGVARLPIAEAKKLIVTRGLPARAEAPADPTLGTRRAAYGESSGGRTIGAPAARARREAAERERAGVGPREH